MPLMVPFILGWLRWLIIFTFLLPTAALAERLELSVADGHSGRVLALAWSADGEFLLSGGSDETARLWQVEQGALVRRFSSGVMTMRGIGRTISGLSFIDAPASVLVAGSFGAFAADMRTGQVTSPLLPEERSASAIVGIPGASRVVVGGTDLLETRDVASGDAVSLLPLLEEIELYDVTALTPDATGRFLAVSGARIASRDTSNSITVAPLVLLFDLAERRLVRTIRPEGKKAADWAGVTRGGETLLALVEGELLRWRIADGQLLDRRSAHGASANRDATVIAYSAWSTSTQFWSVNILDGQQTAPIACPNMDDRGCLWELPSAIAVSPDGRQVALGSRGGAIAVYDIPAGRYTWQSSPRATAPFHHNLLSEDGRRLLFAGQNSVSVWDLLSSEVVYDHAASSEIDATALSPDGRYLAIGERNGTVAIIDTRDRNTVNADLRGPSQALQFFHDGQHLAVADYSTVYVIDVNTGKTVRTLGSQFKLVRTIAVTRDDQTIAIGDEAGEIYVYGTGPEPLRFPAPNPFLSIVLDAEFDPEGRYLLVGYGNGDNTIRRYDLKTGENKLVGRHVGFVSGVAFGPSEHVAFGGDWGATTKMWDVRSGQELAGIRHEAPVTALGYNRFAGYLATLAGNRVQLWNVTPGAVPSERLRKIADLVRLPNGNLVTIDVQGRFAANDIEEIVGLHWIAPDAPLTPLAPEIFFRQFFEPGLLGRLHACRRAEASAIRPAACQDAFAPVPNIAELNRRQPLVEIKAVHPGGSPFERIAEIDVIAAKAPDGTFDPVYDLRLFRDGVFVGQEPRLRSPDAPWQAVKIAGVGGATKEVKVHVPFRLPRTALEAPTRLSAYAFNGDRVRSVRAEREIAPVAGSAPEWRARAYVISVGVDRYEDPDLSLNYAGADARSLSKVLLGLQNYDVIPLIVISDAARNHATKNNLHAVLRILAGAPEAATLHRQLAEAGLPGAERLDAVTPDDLLILTFSSHGHAETDGRFFLLPSDSGVGAGFPTERLAKLISGDELAHWLSDVDAGAFTIIIDACHAAASLPRGFRPGPLGDRGLGQLAYDKGMRLLAATQAEAVALESGALGLSVLTYTLTQEAFALKAGLLASDANGNAHLTLNKWLRFAVERVPSVYARVLSGEVSVKDAALNTALIADWMNHAQTPRLFDFDRRRVEVGISFSRPIQTP